MTTSASRPLAQAAMRAQAMLALVIPPQVLQLPAIAPVASRQSAQRWRYTFPSGRYNERSANAARSNGRRVSLPTGGAKRGELPHVVFGLSRPKFCGPHTAAATIRYGSHQTRVRLRPSVARLYQLLVVHYTAIAKCL